MSFRFIRPAGRGRWLVRIHDRTCCRFRCRRSVIALAVHAQGKIVHGQPEVRTLAMRAQCALPYRDPQPRAVASAPGGNEFVPPPQVPAQSKGRHMNRLIYIIGAVVVIIAVLSFFGLR